jgi:prophage regulatory protein
MQISPTSPLMIERLPAVLARVGMSRSFVYAAIAAKTFPAPRKFGRASGWDSRAVDAWIEAALPLSH